MKILILSLAIAVFSNFALAAINKHNKTFEMKVRLSLGNRLIVVPSFSLPERKIATFTKTIDNEKFYLTVTADEQGQTDDKKSMILFVLNIGKMDPNGVKSVLSSSRIVTLEGEQAQMTESDRNGQQVLSVSVIASKKK